MDSTLCGSVKMERASGCYFNFDGFPYVMIKICLERERKNGIFLKIIIESKYNGNNVWDCKIPLSILNWILVVLL